MIISLMMALPFLALLIVLSILARSHRFSEAVIVLLWIVCGMIWADHIDASSKPDYNEGPGGALGVAFFAMVTLGVVFATILYAIFRVWYAKRPAVTAG